MEKELLKHLNFLTEIRPFRNWTNLESLAVAAKYVEDEFKSYGLPTSRQNWNVGNFAYDNIIATYQPDPENPIEKKLIVGAHYDVYSNQPGADDNTSGVAGLLLLAKMVAEQKPDLPYQIEFVSYCLEEPPNFGTKNMGSYVHAESLNKSNADVVGMICLDMIGYFSDEPNSQKYPVAELAQRFPTIGNYIAIIGHKDHSKFSGQVHQLMKDKGGIDLQLINFPSSDGLAGLSDHRNYWYFGYDAVMINDTAKYRNPNYHEPTDTVDTLDLEKMNAVVQCLLNVISTPLVQGEKKPPKTSEKEAAPPKTDRLSLFKRILAWLRNRFSRKG